jgi:hypothetical protein
MDMVDCLFILRCRRGAAAGSSRPGLFAAQFLHLCCSNPALADTLAPDSFNLSNGQHLGAAPAVTAAPGPNVHLIESAAVTPILLRVSQGTSKTQTVLEGMRNSGVTVVANEEWNQGCSPQELSLGRCRDRAAAGCWQSHIAWARQRTA